MVPTDLRSSLSALLLVSLVVTSGCLGTIGTDDGATETGTDAPTTETPTANESDTENAAESDNDTPTDEELARNLNERASNIESLAMTRESTYVIDGEETTLSTRLWMRLDTGEQRVETLAPEENAGNVMLINESMTVQYDAGRNVASVYDRSGTDGSYGSNTVVSLLRNVSQAEHQATETIDGERTYRVRLVPEGDNSAAEDTEITAWVDAETYFPERIQVTGNGADVNYSTVIEYRNVTLNPDIPDSRFVLDPPEDTEWTEYTTPETQTYDSREALTEEVDMSVPDPDLPDGYEFESATVVDGTDRSVYLTYTNGSASLQVSKMAETYDTTRSNRESENVSIGDQEGQYQELSGQAYVIWTCDGNTYSVAGHLDREEVLDIAASVECE